MSVPYKFSNTLALGPATFGNTSSGGGTVVFGSSSPTLTATLANLTSNPMMLLAIGGVALVGLYLLTKSKRKIL